MNKTEFQEAVKIGRRVVKGTALKLRLGDLKWEWVRLEFGSTLIELDVIGDTIEIVINREVPGIDFWNLPPSTEYLRYSTAVGRARGRTWALPPAPGNGTGRVLFTCPLKDRKKTMKIREVVLNYLRKYHKKARQNALARVKAERKKLAQLR